MSKFKILFNKPEPSSEEINQSKDFDSVNRRLEGKPTVKKFKTGAIAAVGVSLIGIAALVYFSTSMENKSASQGIIKEGSHESLNNQSKNENKLDPKFVVEIPSEKFIIDPSERTHIITHEGTIIDIPAYSFVKESGDKVENEVEIEFTALNDPLDIYLAGVSMTYDTNGTQYSFQSGGMFELLASSQNNNLKIDVDKELTVYHPSTIEDENMNVYQMDSKDGDWKYQEKSEKLDFEEACKRERIVFDRGEDKNSPEEIKAKNDLNSLNADVNSLKNEILIEPHELNPNNYTFDLDIDPVEFPELKAFENAKFEVVDPTFRHYHFDKVWDDIRLKKKSMGGYEVELYEGNAKTIFNVYPVLSEKELQKAMEKYESDLAKVQEEMAQKNEEIYRLEEFLADKKKEDTRQMKVRSNNKLVNTFRNTVRDGLPMRRFSIRNLGFVNCDKPYEPGKNALTFGAEFLVDKVALQVFAITLVNLSRNVFIELHEKDFSKIRTNERQKHMAFGKNKEGKLVVLTPTDMEVLKSKQSHYSFDMTLIDIENNHYEQIQKIVNNLLDT